MFSSALLARSMAKRARFVWSRRSYLIALRHSLRPSNSHNSGRRSSGAILRASLTACPYCSARKKACAVACTRSAVVSGLLAISFARPSRCSALAMRVPTDGLRGPRQGLDLLVAVHHYTSQPSLRPYSASTVVSHQSVQA